MASSAPVYTGFWIDWDRGNVLGSTLTVKSGSAAIIIAFLALVVNWAGSSVWQIMCFVIYHRRFTAEPRDGLFHQQQAVLRNPNSNISALLSMFNLSLSWHGHARHARRRTFSMAAIAGVHALFFTAAGLLSSRAVFPGSAVLLRSTKCGWLDDRLVQSDGSVSIDSAQSISDFESGTALFVGYKWSFKKAADYARTCYLNETSITSSLCSSYARTRLNSNVTYLPSCPFNETLCAAKAISIDSGLVSSIDLGINTPKNERVHLRKKTTCTPLLIEEYLSSPWESYRDPYLYMNDTSEGPYKYYYFTKQNCPSPDTTCTNASNTISQQELTYNMESFQFRFWDCPLGFQSCNLIDGLSPSNADMSLLGMNNRVSYPSPVTDPFFLAPQELKIPSANYSLWTANRTFSWLGCTERYQICNGEKCSNVTGLLQLQSDLKSLDFTPRQNAIAEIIYYALRYTKLYYQWFFSVQAQLLAQDKIFGQYSLSSSLPPNQWELEVQLMHNQSMALLQQKVVEHMAPLDIQFQSYGTLDFVRESTDPEITSICHNQKAKAQGYVSFSVLGIFIIIVVSVISIIFNFSLLTLYRLWQGNSQNFRKVKSEWEVNNVFQLQRRVFENAGIGSWDGHDHQVPVANTFGEKFSFPEDHLSGGR